MKQFIILFFWLVFISSINCEAQVAFTNGNVVVLRVGNGTVPLTTNAQPVFLDEYSPSGGTPVQSIPMPTVVNGLNKRFTLGSSFTSHSQTGSLSLSADGKWLSCIGLDAAVGTTYQSPFFDAATSRVIALIGYNAGINSTTALNDVGASFPYSAVTNNGSNIWVLTGGSTGIRYTTVGSTTSTSILASSSFRMLGINNSQLYANIFSNGNVYAFTTGLPTTTSTATLLPGFTSPPGSGQNQFYFADINAAVPGNDVLYIAHEGAAALRRYTYDGTSWVSNGTIGVDADDYRFITGTVSGTTVTIYSTRKGGSTSDGGGELIRLVDNTGYNTSSTSFSALAANVSVIATAPNQTDFRGVAMAPNAGPSTPVKLLNVSAIKSKADALINWTTASEINFSYFEIERSLDGSLFTKTGTVNASNSNQANKLYNYIDTGIFSYAIPNGTIYYRLKIIDKDGTFSYSKIVTLKVNKQELVQLVSAYPNPFINEVLVKLSLLQSSKISISVTDIMGRQVSIPMEITAPAGENNIEIPNLQSLPKGVYMLRVRINNKVTSLRLIK